MHLSRINTSIVLDLSSPLIALAFSRVLLSLEARISAIRDSVKNVVGVIIDETRSQPSVSWRTDRGVQDEESIVQDMDKYDKVRRWIEDQQCITAAHPRTTQRTGSREPESYVWTSKYLSALADLWVVGLVVEARRWHQKLGKATSIAASHSLMRRHSDHCTHQLREAI